MRKGLSAHLSKSARLESIVLVVSNSIFDTLQPARAVTKVLQSRLVGGSLSCEADPLDERTGQIV